MERETGTFRVKSGLAEMLKGGVIMDVTNAEQAKIAEDEMVGVLVVRGQLLGPVLHVGLELRATEQLAEAVHATAVDRLQPRLERMIGPRGVVGGAGEGDRPAVAREPGCGAVGAGEAPEHRVEGAVLLYQVDDVRDLAACELHLQVLGPARGLGRDRDRG